MSKAQLISRILFVRYGENIKLFFLINMSSTYPIEITIFQQQLFVLFFY
jgi:hypothetical protein